MNADWFDKVVYTDDGRDRCIRGRIRPDDGSGFLVIEKSDGIVITLNKKCILRIEQEGSR